MNWDGPILTDSGGYQIFSLAKLRKITEEGVAFQNHIDGAPAFISPEIAMEIQARSAATSRWCSMNALPWPCEYDYAAEALEMTVRWAKRCKAVAETRCVSGNFEAQMPLAYSHQLLFGIVQGGTFEDLRKQSAQAIVDLDFDGYAVGGVSVGEPEEEMMRAVESARTIFAGGQTALRDGTRHAAATARDGRARDGHVRLRPADAARPQRHRVHGDRHAQSKERGVRAGQKPNRRKLRVSCLPRLHARLHPPSHQGGRNSRASSGHAAQSAFLSEPDEPGAHRN